MIPRDAMAAGFGDRLLDVRPEEARDYTRIAATGMAISLCNTAIFVMAAWGLVETASLLLWAALSALLFVALYRHVMLFDETRIRRVSRRMVAVMCAVAICAAAPWVAMLILFLKAGPSELDTVQLQVCAGMCAGGAFALHRVRLAAACYFGAMLIAVAALSLWRDPQGLWATALYCAPYGFALWLIAGKTAEIARQREDSLKRTSEALEDLRAANSEITRLAYQDGVTGLPNRKAFSDRLAALVAERAAGRETLGVLLLDLDRFKNVNDTLGHEAGDALLGAVAGRLERLFGATGFVARLGGDEFAVALTGAADTAAVAAAAQRVVAEMARPIRFEQATLHTGVSVGSAVFPDHALSPKDLLRQADMALADAKLNGRGQAVGFEPSMSARAERTEKIERRLRAALARRELQLWYQPQYDMGTGRLVGAEALLRWPDADGGFISPAVFLGVAEERGVVAPISDFVFAQASQDVAGWSAEGLSPPRISLNVHALDLKSPSSLLDRLAKVEAAGVAPEQLVLEITEGCVVGRGSDQAVALLNAIADRGFTLSLDDFGTGHASLIHLRNLPVGEMKIDKSFIDGMLANDEDRAIVRAAIEMARSLRLSCVAEGVETETQRRALLEIASNDPPLTGQGWLWSKALPAEAFATLLRDAAASTAA